MPHSYNLSAETYSFVYSIQVTINYRVLEAVLGRRERTEAQFLKCVLPSSSKTLQKKLSELSDFSKVAEYKIDI